MTSSKADMKPITEQINPKTADIDRRPTLEIITLINDEDKTVAEAVSRVLPQVAEAVDRIVERLGAGGRLFYVGTGTSGRLGVLDASECPPTFGIPPDLVQGVIAGGYDALRKAVEAAEDDPEQAARDLAAFGMTARDAVVGISASGNTPYTLGALDYAKKVGAAGIALTCNPESRMAAAAEVSIAPVVGPEVIAGSSRMKAGTAQKMILNMLSTATMIKTGLVYGNLMSNLQPNNEKLVRRACGILAEQAGLSAQEAERVFESAGRDLRLALLIARTGLDRAEAEALLKAHSNSVRRAIDEWAGASGL
ncbi:MAG TPA: N-acetylmuramic acid 6-phosphate etherase [Blastocatellia bacterium]|nr:N-acetylmuramic acid 6-phosphate etherase [Blastocatellia bacterium]